MKRTREQISHNMSRIRSKDTKLEGIFRSELDRRGIQSYTQNDDRVYGRPDFVFYARKIAVFCDSEFWHGYDWENAKHEIKTNKDFWLPKIESNIKRDKEVTEKLQSKGWKVLRFWGKEIIKNASECVNKIEKILRVNPAPPYKMIDLCSGIGGIRRSFELTGSFQNILSAEIDKSACATYEHLFGENPYNDLTSEEFKNTVENTEYHVLLSGFPCQPFSRSGSGKGFNDIKNGKIFFHIADIIEKTRPSVIFLENVDYLVYHNKGSTFKRVLEILIKKLKYKIIGTSLTENDEFEYDPKKFIRNSKDFGVPQNRPRTYIIGFDTERFMPAKLNLLPDEIPRQGNRCLYHSINEMLDTDVDPKYYVASGYLETLKKHREREKRKGNGFGYKIVNEPGIERPIANTLLAIGGSGKERNLIYDPRKGIAGRMIKGKKTPLNSEGVRVMTPNEWGKLQGFVNYAFLDDENLDLFSFPDNLSDLQRYKQLGNSVTIPLVEEMARFILECLKLLSNS